MTNIDHSKVTIDPPRVPFMDTLKYKLGYFQGKPRVVTTVIGVALMAGVSMFVAYESLNRKNISLNPDSTTGAANPSCYLALTRKTPSPTPSMIPDTPPPSIKPTPTSTPVSLSCINWANNERSVDHASDIVKVNHLLTSVSFVKTQSDSSTGNHNIEAMDSDPVTKVLYAYSQTKSDVHGLYTINTDPSDSVADGTLSLVAPLSNQRVVTDLSFRKSDNTLWGWVEGLGLYTINKTTGAETLVYSSKLDNVEGVAWDNSSQYLYISRTPSSSPIDSKYELRRYDPIAKSLTYYAALPQDTDTLDFAPAEYMGGYLMGAYQTSSQVVIYAYNVATKAVVKNYPITTSYRNLDAMAICINN
jgi:hypothetical protein